METYRYIYITTNTINEKRYIGQHKSKDWDSNYIGSGFLLKKAIKKYGKEFFTCFPLAWAWSKEELNKLEIEYIAHYKPEYNLTKGGDGGWEYANKFHTDETRKKLSEFHKKIPKEEHSMYGKRHSEESKQKMSEAHKGKTTWIKGKKLTEKQKEKMKEAHKNVSAETRRKMSLAIKGRKLTEEWKYNLGLNSKGRHHFTNGVINKFQRECPEGFWPGQTRMKKEA
jgi:group I intron endonuclease